MKDIERHYCANKARTIEYHFRVTTDAYPNTERLISTHYETFEIYHFIEGDLIFSFEGNRIPISNGDMLVISKGTVHKPIIVNNCRYIREVIRFKQNIFRGFDSSYIELYNKICSKKLLFVGSDTVNEFGFDKMMAEIVEYIDRKTKYDDFCAMICLYKFLIEAIKRGDECETETMLHSNETVSAVIEYVNSNLTADLSYRSLSQKFYITEKNLYKLFRKETGFTLGDYINERRIIAAQSLINAGKTPGDAASAAGYKDYSVFYRNFVKRLGVSPTEYRS